MLFFRKRSKTPDPQEGKMSNPWEKEKKSYQSTIEKLVARKADIYAHLGAAIAYQAKDDPAVLLPYPIQAAALNDIEQKTEAFRKRMAQAESIIQHEEVPWTEICSCGARCPQSAGFCCVCGAPIHRSDTNKTADDVSSLKSAGNRALTGLQYRQPEQQWNHRVTLLMKAPYTSLLPNPISAIPPYHSRWRC